ncbi:MAG: 4-hydroxybenzoate decarboxylase subunit C [Candidatus Omnitrophica bacterium]|nr:4-hydroxybenzoate decarboxylase subunit C [Candidatus Omnitrophota bacterium]
MTYKSLRDCVLDLEKHGHLVRIRTEVDPDLEMAEIHRRVHRARGPAVLYERVKGSPFPAVSNLYGTEERCRFIFRGTLDRVRALVRAKADPANVLKDPASLLSLPLGAWQALPKPACGSVPVLENRTTLSRLPQIRSWPMDAGGFILLPQVYTEHPDRPGIWGSNIGMYRIQLSGNSYAPDREAGLHYQIRRDIGTHHTAALRRGEKLRVSVFVGGPPAHAFAAVMYLPEGLPEAAFAGALAGRGFRYARRDGHVISADADFCIVGTVEPGRTLPEGPFGDHLGYYSLKHDFPVLSVEQVYHRSDAIWPFTVVGRPPQEDSQFGRLVQEIAGPMIPREIPGVKAVHAVDSAGVHPLLLAIGSERYTPYAERRRPQEVLTLAHALLGYGPCSLAKYLFIVAGEDDPRLDIHDIPAYFRHVLERVDWKRDLHFETATTMDTLDYSGTGLNEGSKLIVAAVGPARRRLATAVPVGMRLADGHADPRLALPGVLVVRGPAYTDEASGQRSLMELTEALRGMDRETLEGLPLIIVADDSAHCAANLDNWLWTVFTRSNPSHDVHGVDSFTEHKHWGCRGPLVVDARLKPHHAPPLIEDPAVSRRVDTLAAPGGPLHGIL